MFALDEVRSNSSQIPNKNRLKRDFRFNRLEFKFDFQAGNR
jgi:hypothetical protein